VTEQKLVVYGRSLGSGLAVKVGADNSPAGLILETPYYNLQDIVRMHFPFLPISLILRYKFRSDKHIQQVDCPIAIFHGTADKIVPYKSGLKLYELLPDDQGHSMVTITRGKHNDLSRNALFREKMGEFLRKHVSGA